MGKVEKQPREKEEQEQDLSVCQDVQEDVQEGVMTVMRKRGRKLRSVLEVSLLGREVGSRNSVRSLSYESTASGWGRSTSTSHSSMPCTYLRAAT